MIDWHIIALVLHRPDNFLTRMIILIRHTVSVYLLVLLVEIHILLVERVVRLGLKEGAGFV